MQVASAVTEVTFERLGRSHVEAYLATGEWRDKAGAYAVQGLAGSFIERLDGSFTNVVGLPMTETVALLEAAGVLMPWSSP